MSLPKSLSDRTLGAICDRFSLKEIHGAEGGPFLSLRSSMAPAPVGWVRVFQGARLQKAVAVGLVVPPIGLDSHMVFAFTGPESPVPHFTVDAVAVGGEYAFHLDLIPRVDLGANLGYMKAAYDPLTSIYEESCRIEGLSPARISPRQRALMSPWMLVNRANEAAFRKIDASVTAYLQHWFRLVEQGLPTETTGPLTTAALPQRDIQHRRAIFNPEVDPVWNQVDRLVGAETSAHIRSILMEP